MLNLEDDYCKTEFLPVKVKTLIILKENFLKLSITFKISSNFRQTKCQTYPKSRTRSYYNFDIFSIQSIVNKWPDSNGGLDTVVRRERSVKCEFR